jgi:hypothetical protein
LAFDCNRAVIFSVTSRSSQEAKSSLFFDITAMADPKAAAQMIGGMQDARDPLRSLNSHATAQPRGVIVASASGGKEHGHAQPANKGKTFCQMDETGAS